MLPSVLASELEKVAKDALHTSFHPTTPGSRGLIDRFLANRDQLFKGPYVSISLPFHQGSGRDWFPKIPLPFPPYSHQEKAFQRLLPGSPQNALIATGTGSGKTECFLHFFGPKTPYLTICVIMVSFHQTENSWEFCGNSW